MLAVTESRTFAERATREVAELELFLLRRVHANGPRNISASGSQAILSGGARWPTGVTTAQSGPAACAGHCCRGTQAGAGASGTGSGSTMETLAAPEVALPTAI